jgi:hypothetical protein
LCCCVVVLLCCCVVVLLWCFVSVLLMFKRLVVCFSYDVICHNNHIIINNMTKSASTTASKTSPKYASMPVNSYSTSPKKGVEEKKLGHKIIKVTYPGKTLTIFMMPRILSSIYPTGMAKSPYLVA